MVPSGFVNGKPFKDGEISLVSLNLKISSVFSESKKCGDVVARYYMYLL